LHIPRRIGKLINLVEIISSNVITVISKTSDSSYRSKLVLPTLHPRRVLVRVIPATFRSVQILASTRGTLVNVEKIDQRQEEE